MARFTGKDGKITLASSEVISMTSWSLDAKLDVVDDTAFQDIWHSKLSTFKGWTATVEGLWESSGGNSAFWDQFLLGTTATIELFPNKNATEKYSGSAFIDFSIKVVKDGVISFTAKVEGTGALTRTA